MIYDVRFMDLRFKIFSYRPNLRVKSADNWKSPMKNSLKTEPITPTSKGGKHPSKTNFFVNFKNCPVE